jgi:YVTN family beta-propeller protein
MICRVLACCIAALIACSCASAPREDRSLAVGPVRDGVIVPTRQLIRPAGQTVEFPGRPVDLALSPDGKTVYVKSHKSLLAIDAQTWAMRQELNYGKGGASMHGLVVTADGNSVWVTLTGSAIVEAKVAADGKLSWGRRIELKPAGSRKDAYPCGLALLPDGRAAACVSTANALAIIDLSAGKVEKQIDVGVAPFAVVASADGKTLYVSNWGGRRATPKDKTADSAGTATVVDDRGVASTGNVGVVDLTAGKQVAEIATGLHPSDLELTGDGRTLYVANANSDSVSVIDTSSRTITRTIATRPDEKLPFGSMPNAVCVTPGGKQLLIANGGNNAVAMLDASADRPAGFIPAGWYPGAVATDGSNLYIANVKGVGSRDPKKADKRNSHDYLGSVTKVAIPDAKQLAAWTQ